MCFFTQKMPGKKEDFYEGKKETKQTYKQASKKCLLFQSNSDQTLETFACCGELF